MKNNPNENKIEEIAVSIPLFIYGIIVVNSWHFSSIFFLHLLKPKKENFIDTKKVYINK
jgi:hypothetical protein